MKKYIESADYIYYNANSRGKGTGDCVKRALSMAFDVSYDEISKELLSTARRLQKSQWNVYSVFNEVIKQHGGKEQPKLSQPLTVSEFVDQNCKSGTFLIVSRHTYTSHNNHILCVIDGKIYDSWNSLDEYVSYYYTIPENINRKFTDITDYFDDLISSAIQYLQKYGDRYLTNHQLDDANLEIKLDNIDGYRFFISVSFRLERGDIQAAKSFNVAYVFTPTTSFEAAKDKVISVSKVRIYDGLHSIAQKISSTSEGIKLYKDSGYLIGDIKSVRSMMLTDQEKRFYKSLPGWIKPFVTSLSISYPGHDCYSYQLSIRRIKGDPNQHSVEFHSYTSKELLKEIELYKSNFMRIDYDYELYELDAM